MTANFIVHGPYEIPTYSGPGGRVISDQNVKFFWKRNVAIGKNRGCYVFAIRTGRGIIPEYVGAATKNFKQEAFPS